MATSQQSQQQHCDELPRDWRLWVLIGASVLSVAGIYLAEAIHKPYAEWPAQWPSYFDFADRRPFLRVPNFGDVFSNAPFLLTGAWGFFFAWRCEVRPDGHLTRRWEKFASLVMFAFVFLTGIGSGYFHWNPNNATLFWDRLPMTAVFMAFFALVLGDRLSMRLAGRALPFLLLIGIGSAIYWHWSELNGHGDLRPYGIMQFYPLLAIPFILVVYPPRYSHSWIYAAILGCYVMAKILEEKDAEVLDLLQGTISGHSLKHLAAGAASWFMLQLIRKRRPIPVRRGSA